MFTTVIKEGKEDSDSVTKTFISVRFTCSMNSSCSPIFLCFSDRISLLGKYLKMSRKPSIVRLVKIIQRFLIIISFMKLNEAIEVLYSFTSASYIDSNIASRHTQFF